MTAAVGEDQVDLAALTSRWVSGSKRMRWTRRASVALRLRGVAEVVEHVVAPDAEVVELDPLAAVRVLHAHVAAGPADAVAGAPVVVARAEVGGRRELEALAVGLDPALLAAEAVVAGDGAHGAGADDDAGAELAEDGPLRVEPGHVEADAMARGGLGGVGIEAEAPPAEGLDHLEAEGAERHVHAVVAELAMGPHGGVAAAHVDDGEGLGRAEVGVEGEADDDEEVAHLVLAGEPHPLVGLGVGRPHDADRVGRVVDEELVEAGEGGVLARGRVGRGARWDGGGLAHAAPRSTVPSGGFKAVVSVRIAVTAVLLAACGARVATGVRSLHSTLRSWSGPAHRPAGRGVLPA